MLQKNETAGGLRLTEEEQRVDRRARRAMIATVAALAMAAVVGVAAAVVFVGREGDREIQRWQVRLGIVADSRAADVGRWVEDRLGTLRGLAQNGSLQLYMTTLASGAAPAADVQAVEGAYLRNLLEATAQQDGFAVAARPQIDANVAPTGVAGLALVDRGGRALIATAGMPAVPAAMAVAMESAAQGRSGLMDVQRNAAGIPVIGFAVPVYGIQGDPGADAHIGFVVGIRPLGGDLFERLAQPGEVATSAESYLVRRHGAEIDYISPLADGTEALKRRMAADTPDLAAAFALATPGGFAAKRDYAGKDVLVTGRAVAHTPWVLVRKIDRAEAMADSEGRLRGILMVMIVVVAGAVAGAVALWRNGTSVRLAQVAARHKTASERFENLMRFMRVVTDSQPTHIMCTNPEGLITFANKPLAAHYGIPIVDIKHKPMVSVLGPYKHKIFSDIARRVIASAEGESHLHRFEEPDGTHVVATDHIYIPADAAHPPAALTVFHDITELSRERERAEARLRQLVDALVSIVDRRDPYSANHSTRVADVARAVAEEMGLSAAEAATVELAGRLMNLGKVFIPADLLTKVGTLTDGEKDLLARSFVVSGDLLQGVEFDLPVVDTIRQIGESWDGSGPLGLAADGIMITARVVAVANTFVGMLSPRAYRDALTFAQVSGALAAQVERKFDRRPVSALINILDNRGGTDRWAHYREMPGQS